MSEILNESLVPLAEAAKLVPPRRAGKPAHASTMFRWAAGGLKGVKLEVVQVGGTKCTSREALLRFFGRLSGVSGVSGVLGAGRAPETPRG